MPLPRSRALWLALTLPHFSCGNESTIAETPNTAPAVAISSPPEDSTFLEGETIPFKAVVDDDRDPPESLYLAWKSDIDGLLDDQGLAGSDGLVYWVTANLSPGGHVVTLSAVDSRGLEGYDLVRLTVTDVPDAPSIEIIHPVSGERGEEGVDYSFQAWVEDPQDAPQDLQVTIQSDLSGEFCNLFAGSTGLASCDAALSPGEHLLTFTVTDTSGLTDGATVWFPVDAAGEVDNDGDGYTEAQGDCDDSNASVRPLGTEYSNGIDDDCDGLIDEGTSDSDDDADGFTDAEGDCDDTDAATYPGATEVCDGADNDCDGAVDEGTLCLDDDGDGWTDGDGDCDDEDSRTWPGAPEILDEVDNDCDGYVDEGTVAWDDDGDCACEEEPCTGSSEPACEEWVDGDCDDTDPDLGPLTPESCDGVDNDCDGDVDEEDAIDASTWYADFDLDGYAGSEITALACSRPEGWFASATDCDDSQATVYPGAAETCDGMDDDCDGATDEGVLVRFYRDGDGDGFGDPGDWREACAAPTGFVTDGTDCDDDSAVVHPGAAETCDGLDNDCDGSTDEPDATDAPTWYKDADGDGFGSTTVSTRSCEAADGWLANSEDCDDANNRVFPGAEETCNGTDDDCDAAVDEADAVGAPTWYRDGDGDGWGDPGSTTSSCVMPVGYTPDSTDCDDGSARVYPGASELCDGVDNDCDATTDEPDAVDASTWYRDRDGDGWGDVTTTALSCTPASGWVGDSSDCDDARDDAHPGADETCNDADDDCDGSTDEPDAVDAPTWYRDLDTDTFGDLAVTTRACTEPAGYVADSTDCDDANRIIHPDAVEACNGYDDDCDEIVDEPGATGGSAWNRDTDGDGFGDAGVAVSTCTRPSGYVSDGTDCDDGDWAIYPGAPESCDGVDSDCDGVADDGAVDATTWYKDTDGDGYGTASTSLAACSMPTGYVASSTDCDDTNSAMNPAAAESCNGRDDDCDGTVDDGVLLTWYLDADADGYGTSTTTAAACSAPSGYVSNSSDCDDTNAALNPLTRWYQDGDADGYGNPSWSIAQCVRPTGYVSDATDCNDASAAAWPGATEVCDSIDNDCDGTADESAASDALTWYRDADSDGYGNAAITTKACTVPAGYVASSTDCNDSSSTVSPGATETCNTVDDDCDGTVDEGVTTTFYRDADGDTYGSPSVTTTGCTVPSGYVTNSSDCDDSKATINPTTRWYLDADSDGFGKSTSTLTQCTQPTGYVSDSSDCNDSSSQAYPGATEKCDTIDNDCDGSTDEGAATGCTTFYYDYDGDGYGVTSYGTSCLCAASGYYRSTLSTDCNDASSSVSPGATETCNSTDDDCDGSTDEGVTTTYYRDADGDTYGSASVTTTSCSLPSGYVTNNSDCNDANATINPTTKWYLDADGDGYGKSTSTLTQCTQPTGYVSDSSDCNDTSSAAYPGATEKCDSIDNDCDGSTDEASASGCTTYYYDYDGDGYGVSTKSQCLCATSGYYRSTLSTDCYDSNSSAYPGATSYYTNHRGDSSYDYDCDGSQSKRYTTTYSCTSAWYCFECETYTDGWSGSAPACGSSGTWRSGCAAAFCACSYTTTASRTQSCR